MRILLIIILFFSLQSKGQIIRANPLYRPFVTAAPSCSYLLDQYSGAAAAYSLRKLDCDYAGSAIRVRRSNDNAEQDIGFTANGDLDTATLKTFVSTNSGYVVTWYDQGDSSFNVTQTTSGSQPRIVNSGVIEREGGNNLPTIRFVASASNYLDGGDVLDLYEIYLNTFASVKWLSASNGGFFGKSAASGTIDYRWSTFKDANTIYHIYGYYTGFPSAQVTISYSYTNTDYSVFEFYGNKNTDTTQSLKNNSQTALSTTVMPNVVGGNSCKFYIGVYQNAAGTAPLSGYYLDGEVGEIIVYRKYWTADERTAINNNINTYYSIY